MNLRKRKISKYDDYNSDSEDDFLMNDLSDNLSDNSNNDEELDRLNTLINNRIITRQQVIDQKLSDEDKIILLEYINILKNTEKYTEEYLLLKNKIYNKYTKAIELNESKLIFTNNIHKRDTLITRIINSKYTDDIKLLLYNKISKLSNLDKYDEDSHKIEEYIETVLDLPHDNVKIMNNEQIGDKLYNIKRIMNREIYGQMDVKSQIIETVCSMIVNEDIKHRCIALVGPPGIGKSSIARILAKSLNLPFEQISLNGIKDPSFFTGHNTAYVGAKPGIFVDILRRMKCKNGVVLFDEIDKIGSNDIYSVMMNIFDYTQNNNFRDHYLSEIPIDLSNLFMIITMNDANELSEVLKDRLSIIYMNGYNLNEKKHIATNHLIPNISRELKLENETIMDDQVLTSLIRRSETPGVRSLKHDLYKIYRKICVLKNKTKKLSLNYEIENFKLPFKINKKTVELFLEEKKKVKFNL